MSWENAWVKENCHCMQGRLCLVVQVFEFCAGDEVVLGSAELEEVVSYADLDSNTQPQQFVTEISKKTADGELELLIRARTTWI